MIIAILILAMIFGCFAATAALIAGWSVLAALAIYSGAGVLMIALSAITIATLNGRKTNLIQTDAVVGN